MRKNLINFIISGVILFIFSACRNNPYRNNNGARSYNYESEVKEINFESKNLAVYSKRNLQSLMLGKNKIEVQEIMGLPEGKSLDGGNGYLWDYRRPIFDDSTEKVYEWSLVSFKFIGGLCNEVKISLQNPPTFQSRVDSNESSE